MPSTLQALADRSDRSDEFVAAGEVVDLRFPDGGRTLSARASKLFHLLVQSAGPDCARERLHRIPIAWLRNTGLGHLTIDEFVASVRELASVTIDVEVRDEPDRPPHVKTGAFLAHIERDLDAERGELLYEFSRTMRYVFERSAYWAVLDRRATLAFEGRYAIRLHELIGVRAGLAHKHEEVFALPDLRSRLGVPDGKLTRWVHLRQKAVEPAVAEVNQLGPFAVSWEPIKAGRSVEAVRFSWSRKPPEARLAAGAELAAGREGRRARRSCPDGEGIDASVMEGAVDAGGAVLPFPPAASPSPASLPLSSPGAAIAPPSSPAPPSSSRERSHPANAFPSGPIAYTRWAALVRAHAPRPTPDVELVAGAFRRFAAERGLPLTGTRCERAFVGYCARFKLR